MSVFFALISAVTFGAADFLGGIATRTSNRVFSVVVASQIVGLSVAVVTLVLVGGDLVAEDIGWAAAGGLAGAAGLLLLYRGLAIGTMSVVAPLSAIMGALVPVGWGILTGERPSLVAMIGIPVALAAIVLVSGGGRRMEIGPGVLEAVGAGIGFGLFFVLIANTESAELWTMTFARLASISVVALIAVIAGAPLRPGRGVGWIVAGAGALDMTANLLFLLAERRGLLTLVAVITAMYPASTVVLARVVLDERLTRPRLYGLGLAALGIGLISVG
ncbi:MAG: DMT family transporter [Acidimicrobiia bacterium]|nr:DMT family transporter [Acidimicrobiia bacterium]